MPAWERAKLADERAAARAAKEQAERQALEAGGGEGGEGGAAGGGRGGARGGRQAAAAPAAPAAAPAAPQVRIVDGRLVVDDASLTIAAQQRDDVSGYAVVEEETRLVNSATYAKWAEADTALFFSALGCFGSDFSLIAMLFPEMQRTHIKRKYLKELKENPAKVNAAMAGQGLPAAGAGGLNRASLLEMVRNRIAEANAHRAAAAADAAAAAALPAPVAAAAAAGTTPGAEGGEEGRPAPGPEGEGAQEEVVGLVGEAGGEEAEGGAAGGGVEGGEAGGYDGGA
ncbi:hypothetical protein HXX76_010486 [Chlamydomonas incerta]|uniref:Transcription factor TFIIIB component B'' Myb domain-containing protein n=1 Tax=Chlamydomonas incerta TaxID=51695 RepID=A0A835SWY6_CHLIN|nr:hypothetical protein HXX76_010486 [Chlamydomonas incerta]|eukprot:KAG2428340.1 hypothetical protein HXX76_010486 [Chlamydomonas incerta]